MNGANDTNLVREHLRLLSPHTKTLHDSELSVTPVFTESVRLLGNDTSKSAEPTFTQYGLLGGDVSKLHANHNLEKVPAVKDDPRLYFNIKAPSSVFICGSQGSGKSHTLSCILENCLIPTEANVLPRPLTGIVFHYDPFFSDARGEPCEAAHISSHPDVKVRVLCPPTNVKQIKKLYKALPKVHVQELRLSQKDLNTQRMLDLMAVSSLQGGGMPLYLHIVTRILRELRIEQQQKGGAFNYKAFRRAIEMEDLSPGQKVPLEQRLDTLESFMAKEDVAESKAPGYSHRKKKTSVLDLSKLKSTATTWAPTAGQLTIVDLSCPCVTAEAACALFNICLNLFLEQPSDEIGRVVALDEAHKYMTESAECQTLTESLLSTIRLQRHLGARIVIATQEPTISPKLLDLCTVTIVHRFTSPSWLATLKKHLAAAIPGRKLVETGESYEDGADELLDRIVSLRQGEALVFCPSAVVGVKETAAEVDIDDMADGFARWRLMQDGAKSTVAGADVGKGLVRLGQGIMKIRVRERVTQDGGRSVMAG